VGGGRALAHKDGETWMVAGALPGELMAVDEIRRRAGVVEARATSVLSGAHPARHPDPCPHAARCGGCDWPHIEIRAATRLKAEAAGDAARGFPELASSIAAAPVQESPTGYRLRARLHWDPHARVLGFYGHRSHSVSAIPSCRILSPALLSAIPEIAASLARRCPERIDVEWLEGSDPDRGIAALRPAKGGPRAIARSWVPGADEVGGVVNGFCALTDGGEVRTGWGEHEVRFDLPVPLSVPIGAFFQGNRHLIAPLFDRVAELAEPVQLPVFDLHGGVGFLAAAARSRGEREVFLVEPHRPAARAAQKNLPGARVAVGSTAERFLDGRDDLPDNALAITDPPRSGMTASLREALLRWRPERILMLGCDPATWARDAGQLTARGYSLSSLELYDLFPSTHHVEILALLERR
jgi:23S rRNA (uracil1939-C5)-methyltransferase